MILSAIVSTEQMVSVQIHKLRQCALSSQPCGLQGLLEPQNTEDNFNEQLYPHHIQSQAAEGHVTQK